MKRNHFYRIIKVNRDKMNDPARIERQVNILLTRYSKTHSWQFIEAQFGYDGNDFALNKISCRLEFCEKTEPDLPIYNCTDDMEPTIKHFRD